MTFPCYPIYRTSGIEWLDQVPGHWRSVPIKYMALERNSLFLDGDWIESKDISSDGIRYITTGNVGEGAYKEQGAGFISEETFHALGCTEVYEGDVLVSRLNNPIGRACVVPDLGGRVVTSVDNVIFRPDSKFDKKFIVYLFSSEEYFKHTSNLARGATMQRISRGLLGNIRVVTPSFEEQTQIARFLDHETARIDALIEEQQRLIELLKEKRQAVISHAVTKGLDPTVPMKDSGVEWLGDVPEHWVVSKLKFMTDCVVDCPHETPNYNPDGDYLVIRTADLDQGLLKPEQMYRLERDEYVHRTRRASLKQNDVVYGREGERWGHAALVPESDLYALGQRMMQIRVAAHICPEYFMFQLNSVAVYRQGEVDTVGATSPHVNISTIINYQMMVPPKEEQSRISMYLNKILLELDSLISESADAMGLLQERRSALISAAVTGKIDVRGWQPPASTQAPESAVAEAV